MTVNLSLFYNKLMNVKHGAMSIGEKCKHRYRPKIKFYKDFGVYIYFNEVY